MPEIEKFFPEQIEIEGILRLEADFDTVATKEMREILVEAEKLTDEQVDIQKETVATMRRFDPVTEEKTVAYKSLAEEFLRIKEEVQLGQRFKPEDLQVRFDAWSDILSLLHDYQQSKAKRTISTPLREVAYWLSIGKIKTFGCSIDRLVSLCQNPELIWYSLVKEGIVTPELVDNTQLLADLILLKKQSDLIDLQLRKHPLLKDQTRILRAKIFAPLLERGISPTLISETVKGRFQFQEDYVVELTATFLNLKEEAEEQIERKTKKKLTPRQKLARAALVATLTGILLFSGHEWSQEIIEPPAVELKAGEKLIPEDFEAPDKLTESDFSRQPFLFKPENSDPKDFVEASRRNIWDLGEPRTGYFRQATAAKFRQEELAWEINWQESSPITLDEKSRHLEFTMTSLLPRLGFEASIPVPADYKIDRDETKIFHNGELVESREYIIFQREEDNTFSIRFHDPNKFKGRVEMKIGLSKALKEELTADTLADLSPEKREELTNSIIDLEGMPDKVKNFVQEVKDSNLSIAEKAQLLEKFIKENFIYALEPVWSNYYHHGGTPTEFARRIFETGRVDCDVANTALVLLLREAEVPSRLVLGFMNSGFSLDRNSRFLSANEYHGWAEFFDGEKWQRLDATPMRMDERTFRDIKEGLTPSYRLLPRSWRELQETIRLYFYSLKDFVRDYKTGIEVGLGLLSYILASYGLGKLYEREENVNREIAERIEEKVIERLSKAFKDKSKDFRRSLQFFLYSFISRRFYFYADEGRLTRPIKTLLGIMPLRFIKERRRLKDISTRSIKAEVPEEITPLDFLASQAGITRRETAERIRENNIDDQKTEILNSVRNQTVKALSWVQSPGEEERYFDEDIAETIAWRIDYQGLLEKAETVDEAVTKVTEAAFRKIRGLRRKRTGPEFARWRVYFPDPLPNIPKKKDEFHQFLASQIERPITVFWHLTRFQPS